MISAPTAIYGKPSFYRCAVSTPTPTVIYTYGDSDWGDLLTAYNGNAITYDAIGNPLSDGTWNYAWQHGRQLASMTDGETTWIYTYNADGLRTKRTDGTDTYTYAYYGGVLRFMKKNDTPYYFTTAPDGTPMGIVENETAYYYVTNLQGDVIGIVEKTTGQMVVTYTYDAWGNVLSISGSMADTLGTINPIRYRGYVYDTETGLYYLQSRYYNPETGRFLNADAYASTGQGFLGNNMFAYCGNNPVVNYDPFGLWTIGFSIGFSITIFAGASISIGFAFDDNGNFDWQWSYAVTGVNDTNVVGVASIGLGATAQVTNRDTVYDLYGPATYVGASGGAGWYAGGDLISFSDASDLNGTTDGVQLSAGIGAGVDVHVVESYTQHLGRQKGMLNNPIMDQIKSKIPAPIYKQRKGRIGCVR